MGMINIEINEEELRKIYIDKVEEQIKKIKNDTILWDVKELCRQTCMSWNTIQKEFFYDDRFEKYKVGNKWRFPAESAKKFILQWVREQKKR